MWKILLVFFSMSSIVYSADNPWKIVTPANATRLLREEQEFYNKLHNLPINHREKLPTINRASIMIDPQFSQVGYQPVIVVLPEGMNMGVSGLVSADRRYVRFSTSPTIMFSSIPKVTTYNMQTGQTKRIR